MLGRLNLFAVICLLIVSACASGPTVVRANQFEIVDAKGRVRGTFGCDERSGEPWLTIMDEESSPMAFLALMSIESRDNPSSSELGPVLHLEDAKGNFGTTVVAGPDAVKLHLWSGNDRSIGLELDKESTVISTVDKDGHEVRSKLLVDKGVLRLEPVADDDKKRTTVQGHLSSRDLDVLEAVFRYQFEHNASSPSMRGCYFLELAEKHDPPPGLLARFARNSPPVEPLSAADPDVWSGVRHRGKADRGIILRITSLSWIDDNTVDLEGGYYGGNRAASEDTYRVERRDGKWIVVSDKVRSMS